MHELSIVMSIIDIAEEEVKKNHAHKVDAIELEVGSLAGVEMEALDFSWEAIVRDTVLQDAERIIDNVQAIARCTNCGCEYPVKEAFEPCPACSDVFVQYLQGKELRVKALTLS